MRLRMALLVLAFLAGCASINNPIVGTWVLNPRRTSPAAATNPIVANSISSTLTFTPDGKYRAVMTSDGHTSEVSGTFRVVGSDVYIDIGQGEQKGLYEIQGDTLIVSDRREPGMLIYERSGGSTAGRAN